MEKTFRKENTLEAKGLAILLLLFYHLFENRSVLEEMQVDCRPFGTEGFLLFSGFGNICVAVFVFLTAYGISFGLLGREVTIRDAAVEAWRRFLKLMLRFFILFASVNLLWGWIFDYTLTYGEGKQAFLYALTDGLGLSGFFDTPTMSLTWWYMKLAYILIFLVPVLAWAVRKIGYYLLPVAFFLPFVFSMGGEIERYFYVAVLGVCAAYGHLPDKMLSLRIPVVLQWIGSGVLVVLCILIRQNYVVYQTSIAVVDALIALFLVYLASALFGRVPGLREGLRFLGKHSMNIYLVHPFFFMMLWRQYIYHFHYWLLTFLICLGASLIYSVILEWIKAGGRMLWTRFGKGIVRKERH